MASEYVRVNVSFIGYLLLGATLLMLGVLGLQDGGLFGEAAFDGEKMVSSSLPLDWTMTSTVCVIVSIALLLFTIMTYRIGEKESAAVFMAFSLGLFAYAVMSLGRMMNGTGKIAAMFDSTSWFIPVALAVFFLIVALAMFLNGDSKIIGLFTAIGALMFLFIGLTYCALQNNGWNDLTKMLGIIFGIIAFVGFALAIYIGLAYAAPRARLTLYR